MDTSTSHGQNDSIGASNDTMHEPFAVFKYYFMRKIFAALCVSVAIIGLIGNTFVIIAVPLSKKLRTVTNMFVISLSVSDLLSCIFLPWEAVSVLSEGGWPLPQAYWLCVVTSAAVIIGYGSSIDTLALIALNRWIGVTKSRGLARRIYSRCNIACMVAFSWVMPVCCTTLPTAIGFGELGYEPFYSTCSWVITNPYSHIQNILGVVFYFPLQFIVIAMCYISIFRYVLKTSSHMARYDTPSVSGAVSGAGRAMRKKLWKRQIAVTKNLVYIVLAYVICLAPFFVILITGPYLIQVGQRWIYRMAPYAGLIVYCNTCINPILYATSHPDFKEAFAYMVRFKWKDIPQHAGKKIQMQGQQNK